MMPFTGKYCFFFKFLAASKVWSWDALHSRIVEHGSQAEIVMDFGSDLSKMHTIFKWHVYCCMLVAGG